MFQVCTIDLKFADTVIERTKPAMKRVSCQAEMGIKEK